MEKYQSRQVKINKPDYAIYTVISDFNNFTPILRDKVEGWSVEDDVCSFRVKGFTVRLRMAEKTPYSSVKLTGDEGSPFDFAFWVQLKKVDDNDTRMRLTLHAKLNMMMKMMIGGKLEKGLDDMAVKIAEAFNNATI